MEPADVIYQLACRCQDRRRRSEFAAALAVQGSEHGDALMALLRRWRDLDGSSPHPTLPVTEASEIVTCVADGYPPLLAGVPDAPPFLFARGRIGLLKQPCIAIVGSRRALPSSLALARTMAAELAREGFVIVSGMARGVDGAAHEGALDAGGDTIAVLGSGLERPYPAAHRGLFTRIVTRGLAIAEYPPHVDPLPPHFPQRNRVISGVSLGVVVVEAAERSGSLGTAQQALEQGREVMVVPGPVIGGRYAGSHRLLRDGAALVESAADVFTLLGVHPPGAAPEPEVDAVTAGVLEACSGDAARPEDIARRTGIELASVRALLTRLEIEGFVSQGSHGYIRVR